MFKDTNEGSTHYYGDGCGEPAHNNMDTKKENYKRECEHTEARDFFYPDFKLITKVAKYLQDGSGETATRCNHARVCFQTGGYVICEICGVPITPGGAGGEVTFPNIQHIEKPKRWKPEEGEYYGVSKARKEAELMRDKIRNLLHDV